jgi:hypothetical protein
MTERTEAEQQDRAVAWDEFTQWLASAGPVFDPTTGTLRVLDDKELFEVFAAGWLARSRKP